MKYLNNKGYLFLLFLIIACTNNVNIAEYCSYINKPENGLVITKEINNLKFRCEYKPAEYLILNERNKSFENEKSNDNEGELIKEAKNFITFYLKISSDKNSDFLKSDLKIQDDYYKRLNYYNSDITSDISLIHEKDTLPCNYTYLERNFGIGNESTLIIGFQNDKQDLKGDLHLLINERAYDLGLLQFDYLRTNINNIPKVKL